MTPDGPSPQESMGGSPREERLGELINEFFDRREAGENLSQEEFLGRYPEFAAELREHLGGLDLIAGLGSASSRRTLSGHTPIPKGSSADGALASTQPVPVIPGYEIHRQIGRGGMGIVYKAMQVSTKRVVALKLLLEGPFASDSARKRFEREIALAAQLRHNNIIPIYDSGTSDGRMFYAMEHIYGMALGDYIRANDPDIKTRLQLYVKICSAVGHAHLRGVIHRDLKPSNILVDGAGEPHILDFGLAKAGTFGDMTTSLTAQIVGTPAYMSPEQASGDPSGIDIRTDVYSLGVILYEALTGAMPYETNVAMGKILHNIAHAEPKPLSKVNPKLDGELSAIVLKALDKNKETRYQSVDAVASDVQRYLAGEPITAKPPSGLYLLKKVIYKHRLAVGVCLFLIVLTTGGILMLRQFSKNLAIKEQQRVQADEQARQLQGQLDAQRAAETEDRRKRELAKQQLDLVLRNMDPQLRKTLEPMLRQTPELLSGGEGALQAVVGGLAQQLMTGMAAERSAPPKSMDLDVSDLTRGPPIEAGKPPPKKRLDDATNTLMTAWRQYQEAAKADATSQPSDDKKAATASRPAERPATTNKS